MKKLQRVNYVVFSMKCLGVDIDWISRSSTDPRKFADFWMMFPHQLRYGAPL